LSAAGLENGWHFLFSGDRAQIKEQAANEAMKLGIDYLQGLTV
jgi:hypothetical protein